MSKFSVGSSKRNRVVDLRSRKAGAGTGATAQMSFRTGLKSPLRARRRKIRALAALALIVLVGALGEGLSYLSYLPKYSISTVAVAGAKDVPSRLVKAYVETQLDDGGYTLLSRKNIFLYPKNSIAKSIADNFPRIRTVEISRESFLSQTIKVAVEERNPFALWCGGAAECYLMDDTGFIFAESPATSTLGLVFHGDIAGVAPVGRTFLPKHFADVLQLFKSLREAGFAPTGATAEDGEDLSVSFSEGFVLRATSGSDALALVRNLQLALSADPLRGKVNKLEYVDLRFGNRVYYKDRK